MSKQIVFEHNEKKYTLEYTLRTAGIAERNGLNIFELDSKPGTMIPLLVNGAFQRHHKGMTRKQTDEIFKEIKKKNDFLNALSEMYLDAVNALVDTDADEDADEGNANWTLT